MRTIITAAEAKTTGRPIGRNVPEDKLNAYIAEVENTIIRKELGDPLYLRLVESEEAELEEGLQLLLNGGTYESSSEDCCGGSGTGRKILTGLKVTEQYYVYAQNVRSGDYESARYGMVVKEGDYSHGLEGSERSSLANSVTSIADAFLKECVEYCIEKGYIRKAGKGNLHSTAGIIIRKIG